MGYLVEKQGLVGFAYHPMNTVDEWEKKADEMDAETAKTKAIEFSQKEKGKYRVRSIWDGKVSFEVAT
jgi:hypothetical protein